MRLYHLLCGLLALALVAPLPGWTPASAQAGVYLELTLPDGSSYRFGPLILEGGDLVAPGFYRLVLDGSGYVEFNITPTADTVAALVRPYKTPDWNAIASNDEALSWRLYVSQVSDAYEFMRRDNTSNAYVASDGIARDGELTWVIAYTYSDRLEIHASTSGSASWPGSPASPASRVLIGSNMFNGTEQSAQRWVGEIWAVVIHMTPGVDPRGYEVPGHGLELLFDPTWYDPESNRFIGITVGGFVYGSLVGSATLEASEPRLWVVRGAYHDSYLHLSMVPYGSRVRILDSSGGALAEYTVVTGNMTGGLVLDYPVPWPPPGPSQPRGSGGALSHLAVVMALLALASPAIAWYSGLVGGLTAGLAAGVSTWLALREYSLSSGVDRDVWLGLGLLSALMLVLSFSVAVLKAMSAYTRRLRAPRFPDDIP